LIVYRGDERRRTLWRGGLTGLLAAFATVLLVATPAAAAAVNIVDDSHVLDVTRVQNEAATLPDPVAIYTTAKLADDKAAFDREAQSKVSSPTIIVIAINTQARHLAIRTGTRSRVSQSAAGAATDAFTSSFRANSDYTAATIAALDSMRASIPRGGGGTSGTRTAHRTGVGTYLSGCVCLLLVAAVIGLVVFAVRRSGRGRRAGRFGGPGGGPGGYGPGGYGPANYGQPGYGSSGVSPWVAGGAGAVAGGVLGYELGRMEGEHEQRDYDDRGGYGGDFGGGGADADFGGGGDSGGDSGGGSGDF
jgi:hypothetical protein